MVLIGKDKVNTTELLISKTLLTHILVMTNLFK